MQDRRPSIYLYRQDFSYAGKARTRVGFIALMKLQGPGENLIFPHENTNTIPLEDRYLLIKKVKANLSPIFCFFDDKSKLIAGLGRCCINREPIFDLTDEDRTRHRLWRISQSRLLESIQKKMRKAAVFIADGHHRYEVALRFRDEMQKKYRYAKRENSYNYIMTYFLDINSSGLLVLPIHRLIKGLSRELIENLPERLSSYFKVKKTTKRHLFRLLNAGFCRRGRHSKRTDRVFGMYLGRDRFYKLQPRDKDAFYKKERKFYNRLDVEILHSVVIKGILGLDEPDANRIEYLKDKDEIVRLANVGPGNVAFFLRPLKVNQIKSIALGRKKVPPKSTYFYPKLLSGLVIYRFNEDIG
jgi:uncharacterized protein (DUF1015 family)